MVREGNLVLALMDKMKVKEITFKAKELESRLSCMVCYDHKKETYTLKIKDGKDDI